jgi:hypothetical protein
MFVCRASSARTGVHVPQFLARVGLSEHTIFYPAATARVLLAVSARGPESMDVRRQHDVVELLREHWRGEESDTIRKAKSVAGSNVSK